MALEVLSAAVPKDADAIETLMAQSATGFAMTALTRSEVAVIGGGLVGVSAALGLAALGFRVTLD